MLLEAGKKEAQKRKMKIQIGAIWMLDTMYLILIYKNTQKEVLYLKPSLIWLDATNYSLDLVQVNKTTVQDSDEAPYVLCCTIYVPI